MIKAVIFDVGGVLHATTKAMENDLFDELGITLEMLTEMRANEIAELGLGTIDEETLWKKLTASYGIRPVATSENLLGRAFTEALEPHTSILKLAAQLQDAGIATAVLSNTIEAHAKPLRAAGIYNGFDYVFLSHELHMRKPDAEIYEYALKTIEVAPDETIFIDDDANNVKAAEEIGIKGIVYTSADEVIDKVLTYCPIATEFK